MHKLKLNKCLSIIFFKSKLNSNLPHDFFNQQYAFSTGA